MKHTRKLLSALLVLCMLLSLMPVGVFAAGADTAATASAAEASPSDPETGQSGEEDSAVYAVDTSQIGVLPASAANVDTGSITVQLHLAYAQTKDTLNSRDIQAELYYDSESLTKVPLMTQVSNAQFNVNTAAQKEIAPVNSVSNLMGSSTVSWLDSEKNPVAGDQQTPDYLQVVFSGLPLNHYTIRLTGKGYKTCDISLTLQKYNMIVYCSTGDASFTIGDVNDDKAVNDADWDTMTEHLNTSDALYDLNGDGTVDVLDLAYVHRMSSATEIVQIHNGSLVKPPVNLDAETVAAAMTAAQVAVVANKSTGTMADLFKADNQKTVAFAKTEESKSTIDIPITMSEPQMMEEVVISTPDGTGQIQSGNLFVEFADGGSESFPFGDESIPANVHALGTGSISVNLHRKVAVKKITIQVSRTDGGDYAAVEKIEFLEDIVPENTENMTRKVMDLRATPGHESITLVWSGLPNVTDYRIDYFEVADPNNSRREIPTDKTTYVVQDLENLHEYEFTVTPVAKGWEGQPSNVVRMQPQPGSVPDAPDRVSITALNGELDVSWTGKDATKYQVWYKEQDQDDSAYIQYGTDLEATSLRMTNLKKGVTYNIRLKAGNSQGWSGFSPVYSATTENLDEKVPQNMPTMGLLDRSKIAKVWLGDPTNSADGPVTDASILVDGKYTTYWTTQQWNRDEHVYVKFTEPVNLTAALWVARLDGTYSRNLRSYSVRVWYEGATEEDLNNRTGGQLLVPDPAIGYDSGGNSGGGDVHTWPNCPNYGTQSERDGFVYMPFGPAKNIIQICVACEHRDYFTISLSELKFMEYDETRDLPAAIDRLFTDDFHDTLSEGVDEAQIAALETRLKSEERYYYLNLAAMADELALARDLLDGNNSTSCFVEGLESRSTSKDSGTFSQAGSELQPLGLTAQAKSEITVYAEGIPDGQTVTLHATQFNGEVTAWDYTTPLHNGKNIVCIPKTGKRDTDNGGSLYVAYSGTDASNIKLHIRRATKIPMLKLENWYKLDETARKTAITEYINTLNTYLSANAGAINAAVTDYRNVTELSLPRVLLSLPAKAVQDGLTKAGGDSTETLYNAILAWEELVRICEETQGIIGVGQAKTNLEPVMESRQNIRCMTMFTGAFMYAAGNHVGIGYGSCAGMVTGKPTTASKDPETGNSLYGWGIAHEIGHNMDKLGKAECTNNIYSILAQTWDGSKGTLKSRMELEDRWPTILDRTAQAYPGTASNVFTQLGMYYQLHLAFDGADQPLQFFHDFFKKWKQKSNEGSFPQDATYDEMVALTASETAGKNLNDFFSHWGMQLSDTVQKTIENCGEKPGAIWYLTDDSRRERLDGKQQTPTGSTISATAAVCATDSKKVEITITPTLTADTNSASLQGYEIIRNNDAIAFVMAKGNKEPMTYEDVVGSANNRTFTYTVNAYDTQGKLIGTATCSELRISYDNVVPDNKISRTWANNTATLTLTERTPISGIKISGLSAGYTSTFAVNITVEVMGEDGSYTTSAPKQAKTGTINCSDPSNLCQSADRATTYLTYFNKPGVSTEDTRIWTYDAKTVTVTGVPEGATVQLISYVNDDVTVEGVGQLEKDYVVHEGEADGTGKIVIPAGSWIAWGNYRGDPVFGGIRLLGRFSQNDTANNTEHKPERPLNGETYLFADIPTDGEISTISDGIYIFVLNKKAEEELVSKDVSNCDAEDILPFQVKAEYFQTDDATSADSKRTTAETLWIQVPGSDGLPKINFETEAQAG